MLTMIESAIIEKYNMVRVVKRNLMYVCTYIACEKEVSIGERLCGESHLILNS